MRTTKIGDWRTKNEGVDLKSGNFFFDPDILIEWLRSNVDGFDGVVELGKFKGGQSNPTYLVRTIHREYALRCRPPGALLSSAHAIDREYRILSALHAVGFPVPEPIVFCEYDQEIGTSFYLMQRVNGRIFWNPHFPEIPREHRRFYFDEMNATLARLHQLDAVDLGLADFGRSGSYVERQLNRFSRQYRNDPDAGRLDDIERLLEWLEANIPSQESAGICHGDFKSDNIIFHPDEPRILAVLDWELSTIGDPLADFAFHAMMYRMPGDIATGLLGLDLKVMGIPSETDYVKAYCRKTGRQHIPSYEYLIAFNFFKLAAIVHGIRGRVRRGTASSAHAKEASAHLEKLAALGWAQAQRAETLGQ